MSERRVAKILVALGLLAAVLMVVTRVRAEQVSKNVELVLDLDDARTVAQGQPVPLVDFLKQMRAAGITSVGVSEATLQELEDDGYVQLLKGSDLQALLELGGAQAPSAVNLTPAQLTLRSLGQQSLHPSDYYAIAPDAKLGQWVADQLTRKLPPGTVRLLTPPGQTPAVVEATVADDQTKKLGVGIPPTDVEMVAQAGLDVVPRLENVRDTAGGYIASAFDAAAAGSKTHSPGGAVHTVIFNGGQALGFPDQLSQTAAELDRRGITLGLVEAPLQLGFIKQEGTTELAERVHYGAVRVYSIGRPELDKYTAADAVDRQVRATKERDIRIIYVRPILVKVDQQDRVGANVQYVRDLAAGIRGFGLHIGPAIPFLPVYPNRLLLALMAVGVVAGGMLLLQDLLPIPALLFYVLLILGALGSSGLLLVSGGNTLRKVLALAAAITFPSLGGLWAGGAALLASRREHSLGSMLLTAAKALLGAALISLIGSFFIGAILGGDSRYLLEIDYFRGVKATVTAPLLLVAWAFIYRYGLWTGKGDTEPGQHDLFREFTRLAREKIEAWHILLLAVAGIGFYVYIGRTGNTSGITVTGAEIQARDMIENLMIIRPRTKEFLFGYPAVMLAVWAAVRRYRGLLMLALIGGAIGLSSLVNSFEHLRTPFLISLWRTANGLLLGLLIGAAAIILLELVWPWLEKRWKAAQDA